MHTYSCYYTVIATCQSTGELAQRKLARLLLGGDAAEAEHFIYLID